MAKWTSDKKELLLQLWRDAKQLYNKSDWKYNDSAHREKVTMKIAKQVDMPCESTQNILGNMSCCDILA